MSDSVRYLREETNPHCRIGKVRLKQGNVHVLPMITPLPIDPQRVIVMALEQGLTKVVVMGELEDGERYFASSIGDAAEVNWIAKMCLRDLDKIIDKMEATGRIA